MKKLMLTGLLLCLGAMLAFGGGRAVYRARLSEHWPTTDATITSASVETLRSRRGGVRFHPDVRYQYAVNGRAYTASTLSFGSSDTGSLADAQDVTHHYASGTHVPVHYEPADPSVACLECGSAGVASYVLALGGLVLVAIAGMNLLETLRSELRARRRQSAQPA